MEAPVTTTIFPVSSITRFYSSATCEVKLGYNLGQRGDLAKAHPALATGDFLDALLPLFPLDVVLFPGAALPLHIFEPRYKEMIGECLAQHRTFGVVRAVEQGLAEIGCTAEIITVVKEYPDGRLDLVSRRPPALRTSPRQPGAVISAGGGSHDRRRTRSSAAGRHLARGSAALRAARHRRRQAGSFRRRPRVACLFILPAPCPSIWISNSSCSRCAPSRSACRLLINYLETIIPNLRRAASAREKAGGNGHVR